MAAPGKNTPTRRTATSNAAVKCYGMSEWGISRRGNPSPGRPDIFCLPKKSGTGDAVKLVLKIMTDGSKTPIDKYLACKTTFGMHTWADRRFLKLLVKIWRLPTDA